MRAFVQHRGHYGFLGFGPKYALDLAIEFSNEERAIIRQRALQNYIFDLSPGYLAASHAFSPETRSLMTASGIAVFLDGFVFLLRSSIAAVFGPLALLAFFGGVGLFWYARFAQRGGRDALTKHTWSAVF